MSGTIQIILAGHLRTDDTHKSRSVNNNRLFASALLALFACAHVLLGLALLFFGARVIVVWLSLAGIRFIDIRVIAIYFMRKRRTCIH